MYLSVPVCELFGAGTCGKYLLKEFATRGPVFLDPLGEMLDAEYVKPLTADVDVPLLQFGGPNLERQTRYRGKPTVGYIFNEWEPITEIQKENLRGFDVLVAGSEWNAEVIRSAGFECSSVPQGVDTEIFRPLPREAFTDRFVIYSGGKYEHRKAQDLVIRAVKVLQQRHRDIWLMASWFNIWRPELPFAGERFISLPLCFHPELAYHMNQTDIGLFPNRCEGGTNLILMDYMACGKTVIANDSTGQRDVLGDYATPINGADDDLVEAMIEGVEKAYSDRGLLKTSAAKEMKHWSWSRTADGIQKAIH